MTICKACQKETYTDYGLGTCIECRIKGILKVKPEPFYEEPENFYDLKPQSNTTTSAPVAFDRIEFVPDWSTSIYSKMNPDDGSAYLGRWEELTVPDVKFLIACGIEVD